MKKRLGILALIMTLVLSMLAGCAGGGNSGSDASPASSAASSAAPAGESAAADDGYNGVDNFKITEDGYTATLFYAFGGNGAPKGDMPMWQKVKEMTGVAMENVANESITDTNESMNTMLAAGQLPDIIQGHQPTLDPLKSQGAFLPLDDLIEQYAPNIKQFLNDYPDAVSAGVGPDGKLYTITGTLGGKPGENLPSMGMFIRQDWLDKLNLEVPKTLEEYKNVLYAFRNDDPNGNGQKDEVPLFYRDIGLWPFYQFFGTQHQWHVVDGKVTHGQRETKWRDALKEFSQWYADGVIDPEIFTRGSQARQTLLGGDLGGSTFDWFASTGAVNDTVREQVPDINFVAIPPPADIDGKVKTVFGRSSIHSFAWGVSKDCANPEYVIKLLDFCFSEPGRLIFGFGIEGEDYTMVDGKPVPTEAALTNPAGYPNHLRSIGAGDMGTYGNLEGELYSMNKQAREGFELYAANAEWIQDPFPTLTFTEEERKVIDDNMANIQPYMDEYEQSCLVGNKDVVATWDEHQAMLDSMNFAEVLAAYNSAYERYLATK